MRSATLGAESVAFTLDKEQTRLAKNDAVYLVDYTAEPIPISSALAWLKSDNPKTKTLQGQKIEHLPSKQFYLEVDKEKVNEKMGEEQHLSLVDRINLDYSGQRFIYKNNLMLLDLLATNNWERPLYYATSVSPKLYFGLENYFQLCGSAYQVLPTEGKGAINTNVMYDNMMHKYRYGNIKSSEVHLDNDTRKQAKQFRMNFVNLADALLQEGEKDKAQNVMHKCLDEIPSSAVAYQYLPPYQNDFKIIDTLINIGMKDEAVQVISEMHHNIKQDMDYYLTFDYQKNDEVNAELRNRLRGYYHLSELYKQHIKDESQEVINEFETYYRIVEPLLKG